MTYVDVAVQFTAESDSTYQLFQQWGTYSATELDSESGHMIWETSTGGPKYIGLGNFPLPAAQQVHYWLVKLGEPLLDLDDLVDGYKTPYTSGSPIGDFYSQFSLSWSDSEPPISGPTKELATAAILTRLEQLMGRALLQDEKENIRDGGCGEVARVLMRQRIGFYIHYPHSTYTERDPSWDARAFAYYSDAKAHSCSGNTHELYFIVQGPWKNGSPPTPSASGEIPIDSVTPENYIVRMPPPNEDKWFNVSHGYLAPGGGQNIPQVGHVLDDPPPETFPDVNQIFIKVCVLNE